LLRPFLDLDRRLTPLLEAQRARRNAQSDLAQCFCDEILAAIAGPDKVARWQGDKVKIPAPEAALHHPADGEEARHQHPGQAGRRQPRPGDQACAGAGPLPTASSRPGQPISSRVSPSG